MNILLVIHSLLCGGAERVLSTLANAWAERGHCITVATMDNSAPFYPLASSVCIRPIGIPAQSGSGIMARVGGNWRRLAALQHCIEQVHPDLVISFMTRTNVIAILAARNSGVRVVACEHTDPRHQELNPVWSALRIATYPLADAVTFLTSNVARRWELWLGGRAHLMPNPIAVGPTGGADGLTYPRNLIAAGRLIPLKGFDLLVEAFQRIAGRHADWGLTILGEGSMRSQLERQIEKAGLTGQVHLPGLVPDPHAWFAAADLFVLSSLHEGLPCALCEAMACGLPAVSFDCESGPADVIRDGVNGVLVPAGNANSLADALDCLMTDTPARERMGLRAVEVQERFGIETSLARWDRLFRLIGAEP